MGFLRRVHDMTLRNKVESAQLWNLWNPECRFISPSSRKISDTLVRPFDQNVPGNIGEASPAGYTHGKVDQRPGGVATSATLLGPVFLCGASRTIWDFCWREVHLLILGELPPRPSPQRKAGMKRSEWLDLTPVRFNVICTLLVSISAATLLLRKCTRFHDKITLDSHKKH